MTVPAGVAVAFREEGATQQSGQLSAGIEATPTGSGLRITVHQGEQRSGGYAIQIQSVTRVGGELRVHAAFTVPAKDALVTMALTSPAHTVSVDETAAVVVLYDTSGVERARARPR